MPGPPTKWLPEKLISDVQGWDFQNTVTSGMSDLADMGSRLMQPVVRQVRDVVEQAMPAPQPLPHAPAPPPEAPRIPRFSLGTPEDWMTPAKSPGPEPVTAQSGSFSLPSPSTWFGNLAPRPAEPSQAPLSPVGQRPATATATAAPAAPATAVAPPRRGSDLHEYARAVAVQNGVDPDIFERQIQQESGFNPTARSGVGAQGIAQFMPATAKEYGVDVTDPYSSLDGAARHMADNLKANKGDYRFALAAYNAGQGNVNRYGEGVFGADFAAGQTRDYVNIILGPGGAPKAQPSPKPPQTSANLPQTSPSAGSGTPAFGTYTAESLSPNQVTEGAAQGLSAAESLAICGPAAAVAFARANGRNPTLREAKELAQASGVWDVDAGMHGPASQVQLLEKMGVPSRLSQGTDWDQVRAEVQAGRPVIVDTPQHYYTVTGYDPQTGQYEFGQSAGVLRASQGRTRFRPDELPGLGMGAPRATIFMGSGR